MQREEGGEGFSRVSTWRKSVPGRRHSQCKVPEAGTAKKPLLCRSMNESKGLRGESRESQETRLGRSS